MTMNISVSQRLELAQRLELRLEQRLSLEQRLFLRMHQAMGQDGVDDPMRVRYFRVPAGGKTFLPVVCKINDKDNLDPYAEAVNMETARERGLATPEILGISESNGIFFHFTRFREKAANLATLLHANPNILKKFAEVSGLLLDKDSLDILLSGSSLHKQLKLLLKIYQNSKKDAPMSRIENLEPQEQIAFLKEDLQKKKVCVSALPMALLESYRKIKATRLAYLLGQELAKMHRLGIDKKDFHPRNILVEVTPEGEFSLIHTGFNNIEFKDIALIPRERKEALNDVGKQFTEFLGDSAKYLKAFTFGYLGKTLRPYQLIDDIKQDESEDEEPADESLPKPEKEKNTDDIREEIRQKMRRAFAEKGYVKADKKQVTETAETAEPINIRREFETYAAGLSYEEFCNYPAVIRGWTQIIKDRINLDTMAMKQRRTMKIILALYQNLAEDWNTSLLTIQNLSTYHDESQPEQILGHDEEQKEDLTNNIQMAACNASRLVLPLEKKYKIPPIGDAKQLYKQILVIKLVQKFPDDSSNKISEYLGRQLYDRHSRHIESTFNVPRDIGLTSRTLRKFIKELRDNGKLAKKGRQAVAEEKNDLRSLLGEIIEKGETVEISAISTQVNEPEETVQKIYEQEKEKYLWKIVKAGLDTGETIETAMLAIQFDTDIESLENRMEQIRQKIIAGESCPQPAVSATEKPVTKPAQAPPPTPSVNATPPTPSVNDETLGVDSPEPEPEPVPESPAAPIQTVTAPAAPPTMPSPAPQPSVQPAPTIPQPPHSPVQPAPHPPVAPPAQTVQPAPQPSPRQPESHLEQRQIVHIMGRIATNPAYPTQQISQELGITAEKVEQIIETICREKDIPNKSPRVLQLIQTRPGVGDSEIMEATGYTVEEVHLIVRPLLTRGHLRTGRQ